MLRNIIRACRLSFLVLGHPKSFANFDKEMRLRFVTANEESPWLKQLCKFAFLLPLNISGFHRDIIFVLVKNGESKDSYRHIMLIYFKKRKKCLSQRLLSKRAASEQKSTSDGRVWIRRWFEKFTSTLHMTIFCKRESIERGFKKVSKNQFYIVQEFNTH